MFGEAALWGPAENMLAAAVDALNGANWQRAQNKSAKRPQPWPRPGRTDPNSKTFGNQKMTVAEFERRRQARHAKKGGEPSPSN